MKKKIKIGKCVIFMIVGVIIWFGIEKVLAEPNISGWDNNAFSKVYKYSENYDAIFLGTSMSVTNISSEELYMNYGIRSLTLGSPEQPTYLTYYFLKEALNYQNPKVVIFDIESLFYAKENIENRIKENEYQYVHFLLDGMKNSSSKKGAIEDAKKIVSDINEWDYWSPMYNNHAKWENLSKSNFVNTENKSLMNGNLMLFDFDENSDRNMDIYEIENTGEVEQIDSINIQYFEKIVDICKEKKIKLLLVRGKRQIDWDWKKYNTIQKLSNEYGLEYIDINLLENEIGFNSKYDSADGSHLNILGAQKWTSYLGKQLVNFIAENSIEKKIDKNFYKEEQRYDSLIQSIELKKRLYESLDREALFNVINEIVNDNKYGICIWGRKEVFDELEEDISQMLPGLEISESDTGGLYYVNNTFPIQIEYDELNDRNSISINKKNITINQNGLNIIIYDKNNDLIIYNTFFDINVDRMKTVCRVNNSGTLQKEIEGNKWINIY